MKTVKSISIQNFRGISKEIIIPFNKKNNPISIFLFGDNGAGKSSFVDAIEILLTNKFRNFQDINSRTCPEVRNLAFTSEPQLNISFSDGSAISKTISKKSDKYEIFSNPYEKEKIYSPFILRRSDILTFWNTPEFQRQLLFFPYSLDPEYEDIYTPEQLKQIEIQRQELKKQRQDKRKDISVILNMKEEEIPLSSNLFQEFEIKKIFKGYTRKQRAKLYHDGKKVYFNKKWIDACKEYKLFLISYEEQIKKLTKTTKIKSLPKKEAVTEMLSTISDNITDTFNEIISRTDYIKKIALNISKQSKVSLSFSVELFNGETTLPEKIFSEAYLDLLALIVFIEINKYFEKENSINLLVLDDVFQSVDSPIRKKTLEVITTRLNKWQFFITGHDRLWQESISSVFRNKGKQFNSYEVTSWDMINGPIINDVESLCNSLDYVIKNGNVSEITAITSVTLEKICNILSYSLPIALTRRLGDKYTMGDLWPGICSSLKKTTLNEMVSELDTSIYLRNILGGHYNQWANTIAREEVVQFAKKTMNFKNAVYCEECKSWIQPLFVGNICLDKWQCRCGKTSIEKNK